MTLSPEQQACQQIDSALMAAGWVVQSRDEMNVNAAQGVAIREFTMAPARTVAGARCFLMLGGN